MSNYQNYEVGYGSPYAYGSGEQISPYQTKAYGYPTYAQDPSMYERSQTSQNQFMQMNHQQQAYPPRRDIYCRLVQNEQEIRPNEVQMDGKPSIFVNDKLNEVYLKHWNATGTISTYRYVLATDDQNVTGAQDPFDLIMQRLDRIESSLNTGKPQTQFQQGKKIGGKQHGQQPNRTVREESNVEESQS